MDKTVHQIRCEQWTKIINECLASGMGKNAWCAQNNISQKRFYYWQRILRNEAYISQKQMNLPAVSEKENTTDFIELKPAPAFMEVPPDFRPDIIIRKNGLTLEISNTASSELMAKIGGLLNA